MLKVVSNNRHLEVIYEILYDVMEEFNRCTVLTLRMLKHNDIIVGLYHVQLLKNYILVRVHVCYK